MVMIVVMMIVMMVMIYYGIEEHDHDSHTVRVSHPLVFRSRHCNDDDKFDIHYFDDFTKNYDFDENDDDAGQNV